MSAGLFRRPHADMVELVDSVDLGSTAKSVQVRVLLPAPRRRKLHIACGDFYAFGIKCRLALIPLLLLSETGHAQVACSLASALTTALLRYHPVSVP